MVEVEHLVNGMTIRRHDVAAIDYWHVELDRHAVIYAEGVPTETFVDVGNRDQFDGCQGSTLDVPGIAAALASYCRPVAHDPEVIAELRAPLQQRCMMPIPMPETRAPA